MVNIHDWLCANKLSLNIELCSFSSSTTENNFKLNINDKYLRQENYIKYLGIFIDSTLSWKPQIGYIIKIIKRSIGILSKLRYYVNINVLTKLYYALIYPFLIYGILIWGNTYPTTIQPLFVLQKKTMRIITFSKFDEHSSPPFKQLKIIGIFYLITLHMAIFMYKFHNQFLHRYNTRLAEKKSYYLPSARTNYGLFNIRF